jgi:hypothetical protein
MPAKSAWMPIILHSCLPINFQNDCFEQITVKFSSIGTEKITESVAGVDRNIPLLHRVDTSSGVHQASGLMSKRAALSVVSKVGGS